ncbi:MAG: proline--tRNA ligase [Fibrobacter sp.]|nr:proline--tRNA ligase [Fibrobacter sp.]
MAEQKSKNAITPARSEDYPEWYQQVIKSADLAENSPVRGCMVIKPWGYSLWENIQRVLDKKFKDTGHKNAYFPLFIPKSFLEKEAEHVDGFAKECAVVTHHRLETGPDGKLKPAGELEEPLIVRPTSETIIGAMFAKWVQSYRDLPLLINQWANVVRWEMRTRLFLRTAEFLWQEGHTVHATADDARIETMKMLDVYADFAENYMAMPVIKGEKTEGEKFPGAVSTYCIESMMQDRKALQAGTSHFLGQNFAKASGIKFLDASGKEEYAWTTSWGVSTRLIGGLIMTHGDDDGIIIPPRLAPSHVVILPIIHDESTSSTVIEYCDSLARELGTIQYHGYNLSVEVDKREGRGGEKVWSWIKKGIPLYLEIGPRDVASNSVFVGRRDKGRKERYGVNRSEFIATITTVLDDIQNTLLERARSYRDANTCIINGKDEFYEYFTPANKEKPEIHGGFALCHWNGSAEVEKQIKNDLNVTIRCIPLDAQQEQGKCVITGEPSSRRVIFAKAY